MKTTPVLAILAAACAAGCLNVKTESEIKPIHITMDINLKVDKDLDKAFADESSPSPKGNFKVVKDMLDRKVAGLTNRSMLEARDGATDDERIVIADENARRLKRFSEIAKTNSTTIESVQKRHVLKMREMMPSGVWYQDDSGSWRQK